MFKKILLLFLSLEIFASQPLVADCENFRGRGLEPFALITVPKSGSHLLIKTLYSMTGFTPHWHTDPPQGTKLFQESHFPYTHCCLSPSLLDYYAHSPYKQIIGIRDLRDVCVSIVYQIRKGIWPQFTHNPQKRKEFEQLSFDEQLLFVIEQEYEIDPPVIQLQLGIEKIARQVVQLVQNPEALVCRYEDLVGPRGEGTEQAQKELLHKLALHIGLFLSVEQIDELASRLYGNEINPFGQGDFTKYQSTFREGKIGSWKAAFKEVHKEAFKKRLGKALIALGYEPNENW